MRLFPVLLGGVSAALTVSAASTVLAVPRYADVLGYYEPGRNVGTVDIGFGGVRYDNPSAALGGPGDTVSVTGDANATVVSLGGWTDDPATGANDRPTGLVVGFSVPVPNIAGSDFLVMGNNFFGQHEPGFVEVARESGGGGATTDGWMDETFYLLKPANFASILDPRTSPNPIDYSTQTPGMFDFAFGPGPFQNPSNLSGYLDVGHDPLNFLALPDYFDIDWAIDAADQPVVLSDIAYVRIRTVTDSSVDYSSINLGDDQDPFFLGTDFFSTEVNYVQVVPEPASLGLLAAGVLIGLTRRRSA